MTAWDAFHGFLAGFAGTTDVSLAALVGALCTDS